MNLLSKSARSNKKEPVLRCPTEFHSWISIGDWNGNCRRCQKKVSQRRKKIESTSILLIFVLTAYGEFRDCFINGQRLFLWGHQQAKKLTSIMRITGEFRFVEHCSWLLNLQLLKIVFRQTAKKTRMNENWLEPNWISASSIVQFICSRLSKLLF